MEANDLEISLWPEKKTGGMSIYGMSIHRPATGVKILHEPTGYQVACDAYPTQRKNKKAAIERLERLLANAQD